MSLNQFRLAERMTGQMSGTVGKGVEAVQEGKAGEGNLLPMRTGLI